MRSACCRFLVGAARQGALASARVPSAAAAADESCLPSLLHTTTSSSSTSYLSSWLLGPPDLLSNPSCPSAALPAPGSRSLSTSASLRHPASDTSSSTSDDTASPSTSSSASSSSSSASSRQLPRAKAPRHSRPPVVSPAAKPAPPQPRGAKDKAAKVPGAKAAAASAAAKSGGQLPREARQQLDALLAEVPLPPPLPYRGPEEAAEGVRSVQVTGFYLGHPIPRATADALAAQLRSAPLAEGLSLAGVFPDAEHTLLVLHRDSTQQQQQAEAEAASEVAAAGPAEAQGLDGGAATGAAEGGERDAGQSQEAEAGGGGGSSGPGGGCMAIMLLDYGGVAFFNVPEPLLLGALGRLVGLALPPAQQEQLPAGTRRGGGRGGCMQAWRQAACEKLHKEEQLILVEPALQEGSRRGKAHGGRWIRKLDDCVHIWEWDSINLESAARVVTQSSAIRYYNQECEDMLERYETIMPLGNEPSADPSGPLERLMWWRSRLPLRDLRNMVFKSSGIRVRLYSRLGLREPPAGTWESARHHAVWDAMRREFELDERSDTLMEKTDLLKQSCLDLISANNESFTKRSELSIILLISAEIAISLTGIHGVLGYDSLCEAAGWLRQGLTGA